MRKPKFIFHEDLGLEERQFPEFPKPSFDRSGIHAYYPLYLFSAEVGRFQGARTG